MNKVIGIDVSKTTLDVAFFDEKWIHFTVSNSKAGFKTLLKRISNTSHCVMEASGSYYLQLALFLSDHDIDVSVVNPLVIKRFAQMRLIRAKTDKKDAQTIAEYGAVEKPKLWKKTSEVSIKMQQIMSSIELIKKEKTAIANQLEAFESAGIIEKEVKSALKGLIKQFETKIQKLEEKLNHLVTINFKETYDRLTSIPCIGAKAASMLIVLTDNFEKFDNYKQLIAYVGFSPRIYQSGTSVKGKGHICKMGKSQIRKTLYLCSWTAKLYNKSCKEMYERLKVKGKPERVIKIAIANKLLKQAFAIGKSKSYYNENYVSQPWF